MLPSSLKSIEQADTSGRSQCSAWRQNFFCGKPQVLLLRLSADWMKPTHITENNLFDLMSTDYRGSLHL